MGDFSPTKMEHTVYGRNQVSVDMWFILMFIQYSKGEKRIKGDAGFLPPPQYDKGNMVDIYIYTGWWLGHPSEKY